VSSSVVVVGGGVMGASAACHLAAKGATVRVLERNAKAGDGSTRRATGGFRAQYATAINVRISLLSRAKLLRFEEETGIDPGYEQSGYLWLAADEREQEILRKGIAIQRAEGLTEVREVPVDEVSRLSPLLSLDGIAGGVFCPTDGFIRALRITDGYVALAKRMGAVFEWGVEVTGVTRNPDGAIDALQTTRGAVFADAFVNAAGAWAGQLAALAGLDVPIVPLRRQVAATVPVASSLLPKTTPMTIFAGDGFHFRERDGRALLLWPTPGIPGRPWDTSLDPDWIEEVVAKTRRRVPALGSVPVDFEASWAGLYEMSPDKHAILGRAPGCPNLFLINGSSGHGVMHAPALGQLLAEIVVDGRATALDVSALDPGRFAAGRLNPVSELL
jgi:sarcosine oxidase, subunit beta